MLWCAGRPQREEVSRSPSGTSTVLSVSRCVYICYSAKSRARLLTSVSLAHGCENKAKHCRYNLHPPPPFPPFMILWVSSHAWASTQPRALWCRTQLARSNLKQAAHSLSMRHTASRHKPTLSLIYRRAVKRDNLARTAMCGEEARTLCVYAHAHARRRMLMRMHTHTFHA